jgi:hypothetical protein
VDSKWWESGIFLDYMMKINDETWISAYCGFNGVGLEDSAWHVGMVFFVKFDEQYPRYLFT